MLGGCSGAGLAPADTPDLVVASASVDDGGPVALATITVSAAVRNAGSGTSAATTLRFFRSTDETISRDDPPVGTVPVPRLGASASSSRSLDVTAPPRPGTYHFGACADPVEDESATANNCSPSVPVNVSEPPSAPNLVVEAHVSQSAGATFSLSATVRNIGDAASAATTLRFYRSADETIDTDGTEVSMATVPGLAAAGGSGAAVQLTAPPIPGTYHYGACVAAVAGESATDDNCSSAVPVTVPEPDRGQEAPLVNGGTLPVAAAPDLNPYSTEVTTGIEDVPPGTTFAVSASVRNDGNGTSAATTVRFYRSTDQTIDSGDTQVGSDRVPPLASSGTSTHSADLTAPSAPGEYYYGVCLDAVANDSDLTNDCSSGMHVRVRERRPDLMPSTLMLGRNDLLPGGRFQIGIVMLNRGDGTAPTTILRFYRSEDTTITRSDTQVGTAEVASLPPSGRQTIWTELTAPASPGTYYYGGCADAVENDRDTFNDCSTRIGVRVVALQPNLHLGVPGVSPGTVEPGDTFSLRLTVHNAGNVVAPATTLRYYRSEDATITRSDAQVGTAELEALPAGGSSREMSVSLTAPTTVGYYYYGACVDAVPHDSDYANDCSSGGYNGWGRVQVVVAQSSDLTVGNTTAGSGPFIGKRYLVTAVKNRGPQASFSTTLRFYISTDSSISAQDDTVVGSVGVPSVQPNGSSSELRMRVTLPSENGTYYYGACVDATRGETNTSNNCGTQTLSVTIPLSAPDPEPTPVPTAPEPSCGTSDLNEIWCATLTIKTGNTYGYNRWNSSGLKPNKFTYRGVTMEVRALEYVRNRLPFLKFWLDRYSGLIPGDGLFGGKSFTLILDDGTATRSFHVSDGGYYYTYFNPGLRSWQHGDTVAVKLRLNPVPTAEDSTVTTSVDTDYPFNAADFNFADAYGDTLRRVKVKSLPALGTLKLNDADMTAGDTATASQLQDGDFTYTPPAGRTGTALTTFTFKVNDGISDSASYTMTIDVTP